MKIASITIHKHEMKGLLLAFIYFFFLMSSYYILRPIRDEMAITGGIKNIPWLFTATFFVILAMAPIMAWLMTHYRRKQFIPIVYYAAIVSLVIFYIVLLIDRNNIYVARIFYVWVSVYVLLAVSIFWSFMLDLFSAEQSKRLFGFIAAGGSTGALVGPTITILAIPHIGVTNLFLVSALLLLMLVICVHLLIAWHNSAPENTMKSGPQNNNFNSQLGDNTFSALYIIKRSPYLIGICIFLFLLTLMATFLYFLQAYIVDNYFQTRSERTDFFAKMELATNLGALLIQMLLTANLIRWIKLSGTLMLIPVILAVGFTILAVAPVLLVLVVVHVIRRAGNYAIMRPGREMLFSILTAEEKYKVKNFIDTVVYRGGDALSGWLYAALIAAGLSLGGTAFFAVPIAVLWGFLGYHLGKARENQEHNQVNTLSK